MCRNRLLEMKWAEHTYKWLVQTKLLVHLAVSSLSVCTAYHLQLVYRAFKCARATSDIVVGARLHHMCATAT